MFFHQTLIAVIIFLGVLSDSILRLKRIFKKQEEAPEPTNVLSEFNRLWEADRTDREAWEAEYRKQVGPLPSDNLRELLQQQQALAQYNQRRQPNPFERANMQAMQNQSSLNFGRGIDPALLAQLLGGPKC